MPGVDLSPPGLRRHNYRGGEQELNIMAVRHGLLPLLTSRVSLFKELLIIIYFPCTIYQTGDYMEPASTVLVQSTVVEGYALFSNYFHHLWKRYLIACAPSTLVPGPE